MLLNETTVEEEEKMQLSDERVSATNEAKHDAAIECHALNPHLMTST